MKKTRMNRIIGSKRGRSHARIRRFGLQARAEQQRDEVSRKYNSVRPQYEAFTNYLKELVERILKRKKVELVQIEARTKDTESFTEKVFREDKNYRNPLRDVTDISGIRVICYYVEDLKTIGNVIKDEFEIDEKRSNYRRNALDPNTFGYLSDHYIIEVDSERANLPEWAPFLKMKAEIQVRTVLQNAWAAFDHKLTYKKKSDVPESILRRINGLSALLETADEDFSDVKRRLKEIRDVYRKKIKAKRLDFDLDIVSLDVYIDTSGILNNLRNILFRDRIVVIQTKNASKVRQILLNALRKINIRTVQELDTLVHRSLKTLPSLLKNFKAYRRSKNLRFITGEYFFFRLMLYSQLTAKDLQKVLKVDLAIKIKLDELRALRRSQKPRRRPQQKQPLLLTK